MSTCSAFLVDSGATSTVYKAYQAELDRFVAVKVLHLSASDPLFTQRFKLDQINEACHALEKGQIAGRSILVFD